MKGLRSRVWGAQNVVEDLGFRVYKEGHADVPDRRADDFLRVGGLEFEVWGVGFRVQALGFGVESVGCMMTGER